MKQYADILALAAASTVLALLVAHVAFGANIMTYAQNVTNTPSVVGQAQGRQRLSVQVATAAPGLVSCGPCDLPASSYWPIAPGNYYTWGDEVDGQFTAEAVMCCAAANGTPHAIKVSEEGKMPDLTATMTNTATATPANTATDTPVPTDTP